MGHIELVHCNRKNLKETFSVPYETHSKEKLELHFAGLADFQLIT